MTQETRTKLRKVELAASGLPSANRLLAALQATPQLDGMVYLLIATTIEEARKEGNQKSELASSNPTRLNLDDAASVVGEKIAFITPRGKHDVAFFTDSLLVRTTKTEVVVPYKAIQTLIILDSIPKDTKGRVYLYMHLDKNIPIMNGKVPLTAIVIQVTAEQQLDIPHPCTPTQRLSGVAAVVLCQAFGAVGVPGDCFAAPSPECFSSSESLAAVEAYIKARQGLLFPLPAGLCFLESPATFIPKESIKSVELARANGTSSTFDLFVHCGDGLTIEFSNISRSEVPSIEDYIRTMKFTVGANPDSASETESGGNGGEQDGVSDDDNSDDPEDEDFMPCTYKERKQQNKRKRDSSEKQGEDFQSDSDESDSDESDSDENGSSVELVSEDDFSMGQFEQAAANDTDDEP